MTAFSKLQIRSAVLSAITEIKQVTEINDEIINRISDVLTDIDDKKSLFDIFIKEYLKLDEEKCNICAFILKNIIPVDYMAEAVTEMIKDSVLSDELKYKLVQLMRIAELPRDLSELPQYFQHPEKILDKETKKMLETATVNPESMLDFLDFISAVSSSDRNVLVEALSNDYGGDELANIIYPILYSDFEDNFKLKIAEILSDSKSSLAIKPFEYLIQTSENQEIVSVCKTGLKKLKLAGCTTEKAEMYFKHTVSNSLPGECFATLPDGAGNQAFIVTRKTVYDKYLIAAFVVNDIFGISDCFGFFMISHDELFKLSLKFYRSEGRYAVSPEYVKFIIEKAKEKTISLKRSFPYEFICWEPLLSDTEVSAEASEKYDIKTDKTFEKDTVFDLLTAEYTMNWFISKADDKNLKKMLDEFYEQMPENIEDINEILLRNKSIIFDKDKKQIWKNRLKNAAYLLCCDKKTKESEIFAYIADNEEIFSVFLAIILQRSVVCNFTAIVEEKKSSAFPVNIFKKKNIEKSEYELKKVEKLLNNLKKNWIHE